MTRHAHPDGARAFRPWTRSDSLYRIVLIGCVVGVLGPPTWLAAASAAPKVTASPPTVPTAAATTAGPLVIPSIGALPSPEPSAVSTVARSSRVVGRSDRSVPAIATGSPVPSSQPEQVSVDPSPPGTTQGDDTGGRPETDPGPVLTLPDWPWQDDDSDPEPATEPTPTGTPLPTPEEEPVTETPAEPTEPEPPLVGLPEIVEEGQ